MALQTPDETPERDLITVLVHGIWMKGIYMRVLGRMLESRGFETHTVSYASLRQPPEKNARVLRAEIARLNARKINLVGHSLGGIVILHLLQQHPELNIDKIVLLGSPVQGSSVAERLYSTALLRPLLGRSVEKGLLGGAPGYALDRPLGIITGNGNLSITALLYPVSDNNDGVVLESETQIEAAADRVSLPKSHTTMIFSRQCADYIAQFLSTGRFKQAADGASAQTTNPPSQS